MKFISNQYSRLKSNAKAKQSLGLLIINFSSLPLSVATSIILARMLGAEGFGNYNFLFSVFTFSSLIITLGFFQAGNRALVLNHSKIRARKYYGVMLVILFLLFTLLSAGLLLYGLLDPNLKNKNLANIFLAALPLGFIFLSGKYIETLLQADSRIGLLSFYRLSTKFFYLLCLVVFYVINSLEKHNLLLIFIYSYFFTHGLVFLIVVTKLKPSIKHISNRFKEIWLYNKSFGFNVYIGGVLAVGFVSLNQVLISYFSSNNSSVGFYTLALTFCAPLLLIPNTIATVYYKEFARSAKVPAITLRITLLISMAALISLWLVIDPFILFFYGEEFKPVINFSYIVSLGVLAHGFGDMYNRFLGANGQSLALRNSAFIVGIISILTSFIFIPLFGVYGAIAAGFAAGFIYLCAIYSYYFKFINQKKVN
jgi:O-antigen/teichoic acid export membrane protein